MLDQLKPLNLRLVYLQENQRPRWNSAEKWDYRLVQQRENTGRGSVLKKNKSNSPQTIDCHEKISINDEKLVGVVAPLDGVVCYQVLFAITQIRVCQKREDISGRAWLESGKSGKFPPASHRICMSEIWSSKSAEIQ